MAALTLSGCQIARIFQDLTIHDKAIYADEGMLGAYEVHTLTSAAAHISKAEWDKTRVGMLCMSSDEFADYKSNEEKACSLLANGCTYDEQAAVHSFFLKMAAIHRAGQHAKANVLAKP